LPANPTALSGQISVVGSVVEAETRGACVSLAGQSEWSFETRHVTRVRSAERSHSTVLLAIPKSALNAANDKDDRICAEWRPFSPQKSH